MNEAVLIELAKRWEQDAVEPNCENGASYAAEENAKAKGKRETLRGCADTLRMLVSALGDR